MLLCLFALMRNLMSISLAVFYLTISMGMGLHLHFCGGEIADIALYAEGQHTCCCPTDADDSPMDGCCENEAVPFQLVTESLPESMVKTVAHAAEQVPHLPSPPSFISLFKAAQADKAGAFTPTSPPPKASGKSIRIAGCSLVLYA